MSKNRLYTLLYIVFTMVLLTACAKEKTHKIGVSQCSGGQWREKVNNEMLAAQHLYEQTAEVTIACAYDNTERQIRQIDSLVNSGIDLLVVAPNEEVPLSDAITRVRKRGIPVICFDRKVGGDNYTAFIGGSNVEAGHAIGVNAVDVAKGMTAQGHRPLVLEITATMSCSPAKERHEGFSEAMKGHEELDYIWKSSDWSSEEAYRIAKEQIETGRLPDIVFCHNDGMATGVYKAVVETHTEGKVKIMGIDGMPGEGLEYVEFGHQIASYVYPTGGAEIVRLALDILTGKPFERENTLQGILVVRENVWPIATTTKELMKQQRDLITVQDKLENSLLLYDTQHKMLIGSLVTIAALMIAIVLMWLAYLQKQKNTEQRQSMNEEQTLFYTNAPNRQLHKIFEKPDDNLPPPNTQDLLFAEQLNEAIRKHMSNPNLKMEDLGEEIGLGRVQLYRKVKAITGQTPVELLRQMRLQRAYALLNSTTKTVAEIAFEVGFNTPGYFSKCFKEQYGKLPMELRED
jgi:ABC-type sugar transport system substrate-binding protein/AraC-like DNA-binding protein